MEDYVELEILKRILYGKSDEAKPFLEPFTEKELSRLYKASKQLSDLCRQEIKRRREM